jgi:exonuclease VII large subunit
MPRANVRSLDSVQRFRPKVSQFEEDLAAALTTLRVEINRTLQWIDHDCPQYWQNQVRTGFDRVAEARTQLTRKSMITVAGHRSECIDEKKALAKAKQNLELAQQKVQACRQWSIKAHHAADEYTARVGRVEQMVGRGLPRIKMMLDRMIAALEDYAQVQRGAVSDLNANVEINLDAPRELDAAPPTAKADEAAAPSAESAAAENAGGEGESESPETAPPEPVARAHS